ncbi:MAG: class I SAM-dependent methyltransferase [Verrucomicrobia bacterium]|nr:class I SAM-dependent methyltransferase [Verrucomicrobiota bacterium]MBS0636132.1 class I SAM-dependent methyltransferase [Verrucomicrobiota bacterium]
MNDDYELIDSGNGAKLERFGSYTLARPCSQAVWKKSLPETVWDNATATFSRISENRWQTKGKLPETWTIKTQDILFKLSCTDFGHLGIFAEVRPFWHWIRSTIQAANRPIRLLNLFAYSGGVTLAAAQAGAEVCHLDASKGMVAWARENAALNGLENAPIRWIVEDVQKFINREIKRGKTYDAIVLDPPSFGRGSQGELFKIEEHINPLLDSIKALLSDKPLFVLFSCHTPGFTPTALKHLLSQRFKGTIDTGEMLLEGSKCFSIPSGAFARWTP